MSIASIVSYLLCRHFNGFLEEYPRDGFGAGRRGERAGVGPVRDLARQQVGGVQGLGEGHLVASVLYVRQKLHHLVQLSVPGAYLENRE